MITRRSFLHSVAASALLPYLRAQARMRFGCAAITWAGNDLQAMDDIAALGFPGIQLRSNVLSRFGEKPAELRAILERHKLHLAAFSSGAVRIDRAARASVIAEHVDHARFVRDVGGELLQLTDQRPAGRSVTPDDCKQLGELLTEIGRRSADLGVTAAYHPHMGTIGETPGDAERVLAASDARYVSLLLDVAHYLQGGGDPAAAIRRHRERLKVLHLKDVERPRGGAENAFRFVELGRGRVNFDAVFAALNDMGFDGWAIVELDDTTDPNRSPMASAEISKRFLEARGFSIS